MSYGRCHVGFMIDTTNTYFVKDHQRNTSAMTAVIFFYKIKGLNCLFNILSCGDGLLGLGCLMPLSLSWIFYVQKKIKSCNGLSHDYSCTVWVQ